VLLGSGVDCAMDHVVLDDVDASALVLTAAADDDILLLNACVDGLGVAVLEILDEVDDVNTICVYMYVYLYILFIRSLDSCQFVTHNITRTYDGGASPQNTRVLRRQLR